MPLSPLAEVWQLCVTDRLSGPRARLMAFAALVRTRLHRAAVMARLMVAGDGRDLAEGWNRKP
jgi:hypothetical protein